MIASPLATREPLIRLLLGLGDDEVVIDGFAGGGGTSEGFEMAIGRPPDIAINHDPIALAMHKANHPETRHIVSNIRHVRYEREVPADKRVGIAWFSPDCTHHSKARGGKPFRDRTRARRIRGLAWEAVRCVKALGPRAPRIIILENVEEWRDWCPLLADGTPDWSKRGASYRRWKRELARAGEQAVGRPYVIEDRELVASNHGAPTKRKRLIVIARCDGQAPVWPAVTHGPSLTPFRTAAEYIDFSRPVPSIFLTQAQARQWAKTMGLPKSSAPRRPLAAATKRRIARGVERFVLKCPEPFIVKYHGHGEFRGQVTSEPIRTLDTSNRFGLVQPTLAPLIVNNSETRGDRVYSADEPIRTLTAEGCRTYQLVTPLLAPFITEHANASSQRNMPADEPLRTICAQVKGGHFALVTPFLAAVRHHDDSHLHSVQEPIRTIPASDGEFALVAPTLINTRNGERKGQEPRVMDIRAPYPTVTAQGSQGALVAAFLAKHNAGHEATGQVLSRPIDTVTTKDSKALVTSHLVTLRGGLADHANTAQDLRQPLPTQTAGGTHYAEVRITLVPRESLDPAHVDRAVQTCAFLVKYFGTGVARPLDQPVGTLTTKDRIGLVQVVLLRVGDAEWVLADIGMRMLTPRELFLCQGFPPEYQIDQVPMMSALGIEGMQKLTKKEQTRLVGNSVPPQLAAAIIRANLGVNAAAVA